MMAAIEVGDVARVVAFVLPGYVASRFYSLQVWTKKRNDLEFLASSLLTSLAAYGIAAASIYSLNHEDWRLHSQVSLENWEFVVGLYLVAAAIGIALGQVVRSRLLRILLGLVGVDWGEHPSVWNEVWQAEGGAMWVLVRLKDGSTAYGALRGYTGDPDETRRELWLHPVYELDEDDPEADPQLVPGLSLYVPGDQIVTVSAYRPQDAPEQVDAVPPAGAPEETEEAGVL
jgi:hypothetical protein